MTSNACDILQLYSYYRKDLAYFFFQWRDEFVLVNRCAAHVGPVTPAHPRRRGPYCTSWHATTPTPQPTCHRRQGNRATQPTPTVNPGKKRGGGGSHGDHSQRGQAATHPTTVDDQPQPAAARCTTHEEPPFEQAKRPPTTATNGPQQERTGSHTHRTPSPPQPATGPNQEGRRDTHKARHHTGQTTAPTSAYANPHPRKAENNTHRSPPRNGTKPPHHKRR